MEAQSYSVRLRILARKSIIGFGAIPQKDLSVQQMLDLKMHKKLVNIYYRLDKISFADDILNELCIETEDRIIKPGKVVNGKERVNIIMNKRFSRLTEVQLLAASSLAKAGRKRIFKKYLKRVARNSKGNDVARNQGRRKK